MPLASAASPLLDTAAREAWLLRAHERYRGDLNGLRLSSSGLLLLLDVERAFEGGAWASVIVMAQVVIEATMRDLVVGDHQVCAQVLFKGKKRLERIRNLRNQLVHPRAPGERSDIWRIAGGDAAANHARLEGDAKSAVEYMLYVLYRSGEA